MIPSISPIINLLIGGTIIYYLNYLEKIGCKCALTFQRNYIFYYTIAFFTMNLITLFFQSYYRKISIMLLPVSLTFLIASIINIIYTIEFVEDMKKKNCKCSESKFRDLMFIYAIFQIFAIFIFISLIIFILVIKKNIITLPNMPKLYKIPKIKLN